MKSLQLIFALLTLPLLMSSSIKHEYYVSVTKIEHSKEQNSLQIINQVFIDDFEKLLRERYDESITLQTENESSIVETYIQRYLSDKLKININGEDVSYKFIGKEYKDDIVYCYLEVENISIVKSIEVTNKVLFDVFEEQQNIVRLKLNDKNKSFLLIPANDTCVLNFD